MKPNRLIAALAITSLSAGAMTTGAVAETQVQTVSTTSGASLDHLLDVYSTPFTPPKPDLDRDAGMTRIGAGLAIPDDILELASVYRATAGDLANTPSLFHSAAEVREVVKSTSAYEPDQLQEGMIAYGALVALRDPTFVAAVRAYVADPGVANTLAEYMAINPASLDVAGMDKAAGLVIAALDQMGAQVAVRGYMVKQAAYDTQLSPWSLVRVADSSTRLQMSKQLSTQRQTGRQEDMAQLRRIANGEEPDTTASGGAAAGPYRPAVSQSLALAALIIAGKAGPENAEAVKKLLDDPDTDMCISQAKVTLYECFSVAGPHYEDIFCGGQHALIDTGMCMIKAAGAVQTAFIEPPRRPARKVEGGPVIIAKASPKGSSGSVTKVVAKKKPVKVASN